MWLFNSSTNLNRLDRESLNGTYWLYHIVCWPRWEHPPWSWRCGPGHTHHTSHQPSACHFHSPSLTKEGKDIMWKQKYCGRFNSDCCLHAHVCSEFICVWLHSRWLVYVNFPGRSVFFASMFILQQEPSELQRNHWHYFCVTIYLLFK